MQYVRVSTVKNDRVYDTVKFEKKTALTNEILNVVKSEILRLVDTATSRHMFIT
jgi:hypothetical protein